MKHLLRISALILCILTGYSQDNSKLTDPQPYFIAIVVTDIKISTQWYIKNLGYEIKNQTELKERSLKQVNLKRGNSLVELIEIGSSVNPKDLLTNPSKKALFNGFFKFGFSVVDLDNWVTHLKKNNVVFNGSVVNDPVSGKRMVIIKDPDGNRIQLFEK